MSQICTLCIAGFALVVGLYMGGNYASKHERAIIAQECRSSGSFVVKRTAFNCGVKAK